MKVGEERLGAMQQGSEAGGGHDQSTLDTCMK